MKNPSNLTFYDAFIVNICVNMIEDILGKTINTGIREE